MRDRLGLASGSAFAAAAIVVVVLIAPIAARAELRSLRSGTDPRNDGVCYPEPHGCFPDIRGTTRKVTERSDGKRYLTITVRMYRRAGFASLEKASFGWDWRAGAKIDSRGDQRFDHVLDIYRGDMFGEPGCFVDGEFISVPRSDAWWISCTVPLRTVDPKRQVRWAVFAEGYAAAAPYVTRDRAPNVHLSFP